MPPSRPVTCACPITKQVGEGVVGLTVTVLNPAASNNSAQTEGLLEGTGEERWVMHWEVYGSIASYSDCLEISPLYTSALRKSSQLRARTQVSGD